MNRLVIESIEGRIIAGITMFVAVMVLIAWVAINEPARMASFERQQIGRSVERGGELYAGNCATCHGANGYGQPELVPALNNPQLFGHEYVGEVNAQIGRLQRQQREATGTIAALTTDRDELIAEVAGATQERQTEITTLINDVDAQVTTLTATIADLDTQLEPLLVQRDDELAALESAIDKGYLTGLEAAIEVAANADEPNPLYLTDFIERSSDRLKQAVWGSDVNAFIRTTLYHGRPGTAEVWDGKQMVAWAQIAGGPLRTDEIDDIVNFIVSWDKGAAYTTEDLFAVEQFMKLKADAADVTVGEPVLTINTESGGDIEAATTLVTALMGDAARGEALYNGDARSGAGDRLACSTCHTGAIQAPATDQKWDTASTVRIALPEFAGWTPEQYLIDSIINPDHYVVPGYASGVMPNTYDEQLTSQDLADMLAYLRTYSTQ